MLTHSGLSQMSDVLSEGFFADNVVTTIRQKSPVKSQQEALLYEILAYISSIQKGKEQVSTLKLSDDAMNSINAYDRVLKIVVKMFRDNLDKGVVDKLTTGINVEVQHALETKMIEPEKLVTTMNFFQLLQKSTLQESASNFNWERRIRPLTIAFQ